MNDVKQRAERAQKEIYDLWAKTKKDFGTAGMQALVRQYIETEILREIPSLFAASGVSGEAEECRHSPSGRHVVSRSVCQYCEVDVKALAPPENPTLHKIEIILRKIKPRAPHPNGITGYFESDAGWMESNCEVIVEIMELVCTPPLSEIMLPPESPGPLVARCPKCQNEDITLQRVADISCGHKAFIQCENCEFDIFIDGLADLREFFAAPSTPQPAARDSEKLAGKIAESAVDTLLSWREDFGSKRRTAAIRELTPHVLRELTSPASPPSQEPRP